MKRLGIDEAGRGCVLGPLVVGAFLVDASTTDEALIAAGAADSKRLSASRREEARERLQQVGTPFIHHISAQDIDGGNLNHLEEQAICHLIQQTRPDAVFIDALGHPSTIPRTIERLRAVLGPSLSHVTIQMEPKADHTYPVVGAASIFAKTDRDNTLADLKPEFGDFGSGYPSDPKTKQWLNQWNDTREDWPYFVRTRWGTIRALAQQSMIPSPTNRTPEDG